MSDLLAELRALDPVTAPVAVRRESLDQLRDAVLASPRTVRRRWIAPLAAAAAVVIASGLFWQHGLGPRTVPAVPAATPSPSIPTNTWVATSTSPLSPRHSSATVWADGGFFVIGGTTSGVCPTAGVCAGSAALRDGARYDVASDTWTRIADAPEDVLAFPQGRDQETAVLGRTFYLVGRQAVLGYNLDSGHWQRLPLPPGNLLLGFGASGPSLVAVATLETQPGEVALATLRPDQGEWVRVKVGAGVRGSTISAEVVGGKVVLTSLARSMSASNWIIDTLDPTTGAVGHPDPVEIETQNLATIALTTSQADYAVWRGMKKQVWFLNLRDSKWFGVDLPSTDGAFVGSSGGTTTYYWPVTVSAMVSLRGHLYDPETRLWATTPAMPTGPVGPIVASGPELVLSCFGYNPAQASFAPDCYVLRPAEANLARP